MEFEVQVVQKHILPAPSCGLSGAVRVGSGAGGSDPQSPDFLFRYTRVGATAGLYVGLETHTGRSLSMCEKHSGVATYRKF